MGLIEERNALLQQQNDMMRQEQWEREWAAQEAADRAEAARLFKAGQARLTELLKYAAERGLTMVEVQPFLGDFKDLNDYKKEILDTSLKPFKDFCETLKKEDRYFNGDEYGLVMNHKIKLSFINGIAKTCKESFVIVPDDNKCFVLPMTAIHERTGDGYEGKDIALPSMSQIFFLNKDETLFLAKMLSDAKNAADGSAKAISESQELKDIEEKLKNVELNKTNNSLWYIPVVIGVCGFFVGIFYVCNQFLNIGFDEILEGDVIGIFVSLLCGGLGVLLGMIPVLIFNAIFVNPKEQKAKEIKDNLLAAKTEIISRLIQEPSISEFGAAERIENKNGESTLERSAS